MKNRTEMLETAFAVYEEGNLLLAKTLCHQILEGEQDDLDALCLLGMISHKLSKIDEENNQEKPADPGSEYHLWYYNNSIWLRTSWLGTPILKSVSDMWNYQEIIFALKPSLVIEFGTFCGGSAMFFSSVLRTIGNNYKVLSVDINHDRLDTTAKLDSNIEFLLESSTSPRVARKILTLREELPGPVFAILDSDHRKKHVLAEMVLLRPLLQTGDYLVVEDGNVNGHPILPGWGEGPYEALQEYFAQYPNDYEQDRSREQKFGFTFAPSGFLIRR